MYRSSLCKNPILSCSFQTEPVHQHPAPTNGGSTSQDQAVKPEEQIKHDPDGAPLNKKPRIPEPPPAMFPTDPAYGLYLYQSWAHAAAKLGPSGAGPLHPAAAAAWQAHLAQAVKVIIQYTMLGFEPTTFRTRVSSRNNYTSLPPIDK